MKEVVRQLQAEVKKIRETSAERTIWALVIDDNLLDRKLRVRNFKSIECEVEEADSGEKALELVRKKLEAGEVYDFVCCDYHMDGMSGAEVICELKKYKEYELTTMWCVTTQVDQMRHAISEGLDAMGKAHLVSALKFSDKDPSVDCRKRSSPVTAQEKAVVYPMLEILSEESQGSTRRHSAPPRVGSQSVPRCLPSCSIQ